MYDMLSSAKIPACFEVTLLLWHIFVVLEFLATHVVFFRPSLLITECLCSIIRTTLCMFVCCVFLKLSY